MTESPLGNLAMFHKPIAHKLVQYFDSLGPNSKIIPLDFSNVKQEHINRELNKVYNSHRIVNGLAENAGNVYVVLVNKIPREGEPGDHNYDYYKNGYILDRVYRDKKYRVWENVGESKLCRTISNYASYHNAKSYKCEYLSNFDKNMYDMYLVLPDQEMAKKRQERRENSELVDRNFEINEHWRSKPTYDLLVSRSAAEEVLQKRFKNKRKELKDEASIALDGLKKIRVNSKRDTIKKISDDVYEVYKSLERLDDYYRNMEYRYNNPFHPDSKDEMIPLTKVKEALRYFRTS
jgi:hypothetical protein